MLDHCLHIGGFGTVVFRHVQPPDRSMLGFELSRETEQGTVQEDPCLGAGTAEGKRARVAVLEDVATYCAQLGELMARRERIEARLDSWR